MKQDILVIQAEIVHEDFNYPSAELCQYAGISVNELILMVDEALLDPFGDAPETWHFSLRDCERARIAKRLQQDLGINLSGAALIIELLEK